MATTRNRLYFGIICSLLIFSIKPPLNAWNNDFLKKSINLNNQFTSIKNSSPNYLNIVQKYVRIGNELSLNYFFISNLNSLENDEKRNSFYSSYIIKKRKNNNINELYFWELSILLGLEKFVVPSVPYEIFGKKVIIQKIEKIQHGSWIENLPLNLINQVSLEDYFFSHLLAFILGSADLSGMNIGVNSEFTVRLFDNEDSFMDHKIIRTSKISLFVPFVSVAFDWPHYRQPIDASLSKKIQLIVYSIISKKKEILDYCMIRNVSNQIQDGILQRIDIVSQFDFFSGKTFCDFFEFICPELSMNEGLTELNDIVSRILFRKVDHGISLFFTSRLIHYWHLNEEDKNRLEKWINNHVSS